MGVEGTRRVQYRIIGALRAAALAALFAASNTFPADLAEASMVAGATQSASANPCRFSTAEAMGSALGRPMTSSRRTSFCEYRSAGGDVVVVKVVSGPEGTILRHARSVAAKNGGPEKVATAVGEAYFDSTFPVFIGRVADQEVQIETTIQPLPRDAMIALGKRIMDTLARK